MTRTLTVDARSRFTLGTSTIPELIDRAFSIVVSSVQPVTTGRAMYFGTTPERLWGGGTASSGSVLSSQWHFAEGATGSFFDTFVLLGNRQAQDAHVTITYLLDTGETVTTSETAPAKARLTINPEAGADVRLKNAPRRSPRRSHPTSPSWPSGRCTGRARRRRGVKHTT